ncbi:MAG: WYL domain-containing protein [Brachybacterium sp.]|uniref:WYL domain-containing protein n=1 Tax=Brachybacterium sp. TaxID=1891286 RepID=UPI00265594CB|nr:WYL domain-containing protein [Brachybacterium sp.]MDN6328867.1 WYL domain-containing protein [Brachybacterium sp.]
MASKSVERLLNVIMTIGSRRRIDRAKLFRVIPDYADAVSDQAAERMFERDKASIIELGLPLVTERDLFDENTVHYRIDAARSGAVLDLTTEEYTVLLAASRAWDTAAAGGAARRVRAKLLSLGHDADPDLLRRTPRGAVESLPVLTPLLQAVVSGNGVRFMYRGAHGAPTERRVEPWVVGVHDGHWYLHGWDRDREAPRVFRASRIESFPAEAGTATRARPEQIELGEVLERMLDSDDRDSALLRAAPFKALSLRDRAGATLEAETFRLPSLPRPAVRRLLLSDVRWLELLEPATWREELAEVLTAIAETHEREADLAARDRAAARPPARIRVTPQSGDHLSRLISVASYVMSREEVQLAELSDALGISEKQLITDLQVLFVCGDMGTGWEDLIEAEWEHGTVRVRNAEPLRRALSLSAVESTALLAGLAALEPAAGQTAQVVESARAKLLAVVEGTAEPSEAPEVPTRTDIAAATTADERAARTADRAEQVLAAVHAALRAEPGSEDAELTIRYSSADRAGTSVRRIRPLRIETVGARSYLLAHCELAQGERRFRLDRIVELLPRRTAMSRPEPGDGPALSGRVEGEVWLRLAPAGHWIAESFDAVELRDAPGGEDQAEAGTGFTYARLVEPVLAPLVDAVLESAGAAEALTPDTLRNTIVTVARGGAVRHIQ